MGLVVVVVPITLILQSWVGAATLGRLPANAQLVKRKINPKVKVSTPCHMSVVEKRGNNEKGSALGSPTLKS